MSLAAIRWAASRPSAHVHGHPVCAFLHGKVVLREADPACPPCALPAPTSEIFPETLASEIVPKSYHFVYSTLSIFRFYYRRERQTPRTAARAGLTDHLVTSGTFGSRWVPPAARRSLLLAYTKLCISRLLTCQPNRAGVHHRSSAAGGSTGWHMSSGISLMTLTACDGHLIALD